MKNPRSVPFAIATCVTLMLGACSPKNNADADAAKNQQMQALQMKIDALSARSDDLSKQISDRDAADQAAKREQLTNDQADLDRQRRDLQNDRDTLAKSTPEPVSQQEDGNAEPVYQGKPADDDLFYTKLQNDGNWIESQEYGYIWQPTIAVRNDSWRPYTDGRWVDTDRGWTWTSNERFGWATYHYGRWVDLDNSGWCWVPGHEWAPAWVSWRSSDRYVGWAPLPPEARLERGGRIDARIAVGYDTGPGNYNFVDTQDFGEQTYLGRVIAPAQNVAIINQTTNVTNITYNNTVINNYGPDYDRIGQRSRRPVNRYRLDLQRNTQFAENATAPQVRGDRLAVVAPAMAAAAPGQNRPKPARIEKTIVKSPRENGWKNINPAQRQAVQVEIQKQANAEIQRQQATREQQRIQQQRAQQQANRNARPETPAAAPAVPQNPAQNPQVIAQRQAQQKQVAAQKEAAQQRAAQQQREQNANRNLPANTDPNPPASAAAEASATVPPTTADRAPEAERPQTTAPAAGEQARQHQQQQQAQRETAEAQRQQAAGQAARQAQQLRAQQAQAVQQQAQQQQARQEAAQAQRARNQALENQNEAAARRQPGIERPRQPENTARPAPAQPSEAPAGKRADHPQEKRGNPQPEEKNGDPEKQPQ